MERAATGPDSGAMTPEAPPWSGVYPLGFFGLALLSVLFAQWILYFHAPADAGTGAGRVIGVVLLAGFVLQGALNPWIGSVSDRTRHRWGRRRPFVLLGAPLLAVVFWVLWLPSGLGWAAAAILAYCCLYAVVTQPYMSLLPAVAGPPARRARLAVASALAGLLGVGTALVLGPMTIERFAFPGLGLFGAAVVLTTVLLPAGLLREARPASYPVGVGGSPGGLLRSMRDVLARRRVLLFLSGNGLVIGGVTGLTLVVPFVTEALLERPRAYTTVLNGILFAGVLISIPVVGRLAPRFGHMRLLAWGTAASGVAILCAVGAGALWPVDRVLPLFHAAFALAGLTVLLALSAPQVILARFADEEGRSREGLYFGLNGLFLNVGNAVVVQAAALLLALGRTADEADGVRLAAAATASVMLIGSAVILRASRAV